MQTDYSNQSINSKIYSKQVAQLFYHAPLAHAFTVINGLLLVYFLNPLISTEVLVFWMSSLVLVTSARSFLVYLYHQTKFEVLPIKYWYRAYLMGTATAGLVWSCAAIYLFPDGDLEHQLFVIFILGGMTAAAVNVLAASMIAFLLFACPILISLGIQVYLFNSTLSTPMTVIIFFYLVALIHSAKGINRTILTALRLRFENTELVHEITERQALEEELYLQQERLQITFSAMAEGVIITSVQGIIEYLNPAAEKITGWVNIDVKGMKIEQVLHYENESSNEYTDSVILESLKNNSRSTTNRILVTKNKEKKIIEEVATPLKNRKGKLIGGVAIIRDVTQTIEYSRQLVYQASHDNLTGLPNRMLLCDRLEHAIAKAKRLDYSIAVLFMDLDRFKQINDNLGHNAGDIVLCNVAERLRQGGRENDTVARLGGDEFVVILEDILYKYQAKKVADKIVENLAIPITVENQQISTKVSIGITLFPKDGMDVDTLLKNADIAMYQAKQLGQKNVSFYNKKISVLDHNKFMMEQQLRQVLERNQLELFYQPCVNIKNNKIRGIEALVRWKNHTNILISPIEFLPVAEETGCILEIGEWVLQTACEQLKAWHQSGYHDLNIAVNLSNSQIQSSGFVAIVEKVLQQTKLDAKFLELEITENLFLNDIHNTLKTLNDLKSLGIKLAIDDFGTGYSSLICLNRFPVDILKIDRPFIRDISNKAMGEAILPAIIAMGHALNLEIIAEGVENKIEHKLLSALGCDGFQGYFFSKPLSAESMSDLLRNENLITCIL